MTAIEPVDRRAVVQVFCALTIALALHGRGACANDILGPVLSTIDLPDRPGRVAGFTTQVELAAENSAGYVPVKITVNAVGTLTADRRLVFRIETQSGGQSPPQRGLTVDLPINLTQGSKSESFVRYLPKWSAGQAVEVTVLEAGRGLPDYNAVAGQPLPRGRRANENLLASEYQINWACIHDGTTISREEKSNLNNLLSIVYSGSGSIPFSEDEAEQKWAGTSGQPSLLLPISLEELPHDWRGYQRFDVVVTSMRELQSVRTDDQAFDALRGWVLNGGIVIVFGAPSPEAAFEQLEFRWFDGTKSASEIQPIAKRVIESVEEDEKALGDAVANLEQWIQQRRELGGAASEDPNRAMSMAMLDQVYADDYGMAEENLKIQQGRLKSLGEMGPRAVHRWKDEVWVQGVAAGRVVVLRGNDSSTAPPLIHWRIAERTVGYRRSPMLRRGVDPLLGDGRFQRWLIPGVAQPPVYTFMGLLTLFVVFVGPVAYRRTAKYGRSYLMFAIAPVLALFTTVAMFGYGIVSDGFGTVIRARQLTFVDGQSGDAAERVRATYFAGVRPGEGIRFPGNAEVYAYPESTGLSWSELNRKTPLTIGSVVVDEQTQRFDSSFLPSRQQRQFVTHAPRHDVGYFELTPAEDAVSPPDVFNGFGFTIHEVVLRDHSGDYWSAKNLSAEASRVCTPLPLKDSSKELGRIYNQHRPLSAVRESRRRQRSYRNEIFDLILEVNREINSSNVVADGIFEHWLREQLQTTGEIPPGYFIATADVSDDVLSVDEYELSASVRYVFGTLR